MYQLDGAPGRTALVNGKEYLFFSGYSYLGMSFVSEFKKLVLEGTNKYGLLHPSSRISNTTLKLYENFEQHLSTLTSKEDTVSFSSGYLAGRAVTELFEKEAASYILPYTHAVLQNDQQSVSSVEELVITINKSQDEKVIIYADSVNPLKALVNDFSFLTLLDHSKKIVCVLDDSHGIGLLGNDGNGVASLLPQQDNLECILTYSLSKGLHINGGAVSCSKVVANKLRLSPYYTASTPIAPAMIYAFLNGKDIYVKQQQKLQQNIRTFIELTKDIADILYHPSLPIFVLKEEWDSELFDKHDIIISSFSYPNPTGLKINRIVLNALHTKEDLKRLSGILHSLI